VRIVNTGSGMLLGWLTVSGQQDGAATSKAMPVIILPHGAQTLRCGDLGGCTQADMANTHINLVTSGGSAEVMIVP
jgi:hypothetical protein